MTHSKIWYGLLLLAVVGVTGGYAYKQFLDRDALPDGIAERLGDPLPADVEGQLEAVFAAGSYRFDSRYLTVRTDRRWYATQPDPADGAPFLVLRRWPGDSVLAFYVLRPGDVAAAPVAACPLDDPVAGGAGRWTGTLSSARSPSARSTAWMETGSSWKRRLQAFSQGW